MGKRGLYIFFIITLFLILVPLINAQPPPSTQTNINIDTGLQIEFTQVAIFENGKDHLFNAHVFNISTGLRVDNTTTSCTYHLFDNLGNHQIDQVQMIFDVIGIDWDYNVTGGNFTRNGAYSYLIVCNATNIGGFLSSGFIITQTGDSLETSSSIIYLVLSLNALLLFLLCLYGGIALPFKSKRNDEGKIIAVQKLKYFKVGLLFLSYTLFVWLANLLFALANNFPIIKPYTAFFEMVFTIMIAFSFPLFVLMLIIMGVLAWKDLQLKKLLSRGINPD